MELAFFSGAAKAIHKGEIELVGENFKSLIPSPLEVERLSEYASILAKFGTGSSQALAFFRANGNLHLFVEHARDLERLEQEDRI